MRSAAQLIVDFTAGKSLMDYSTNAMLHSAVERQFIVIGEALGRLEKLDMALTARISNYRQVIAFRNILVHGYQTIDDQIVWLVIQRDLPVFRQEVDGLLAALGGP